VARYLSKASQFKKTVRKPVTRMINGLQGPELRELEGPIIAYFKQAGITEYERELCKERFGFAGVAEGENPLRRVSIYDTDEEAARQGWSDETKAEIEALLDRQQDFSYFKVETPALAPPWPTYDETPADEVAELAVKLGIDLEYVAAYERENADRDPVLHALEYAADPPQADDNGNPLGPAPEVTIEA